MSNSSNQKIRNGKIEFMRFIFCMAVMIFHGKNVMIDEKIRIMYSGRLGVEFFFIVSGYLMAVSLEKMHRNSHNISIGEQTEKFLLRKLKSLYPEVIIAFFMTIFLGGFITNTKLTTSVWKVIEGLPNLALIQMSGIMFYTINGTWYCSSMLLCMAILVPLFLKHYTFMRRIGAGLIFLLTMGFLMQTTGSLAGQTQWLNGIVYMGNLRALSEIALGALCYEMTKGLSAVQLKQAGKVALAMLEAGLYGVALLYILLHKASEWDYFITLAIAMAVSISFSECAWGSHLWNNKINAFLGKASFYLYLGHFTVARDLSRIVGDDMGNRFRMCIFIVLAILAGGLLYLLTMLWKKVSVKLRPIFRY